MSDLLAPTNAEAALVADLKTQYTARNVTAVVGTEIRNTRPPLFTKVILAGGASYFISTAPMLIVECWAPTKLEAWNLVEVTVALVDSVWERLGICSGVTHVGDPVWQPDPDSGTPRYVFTKVLHLRKHAV